MEAKLKKFLKKFWKELQECGTACALAMRQ